MARGGRTVNDYLDLTETDARAQFISILARAPARPGARQVDFTPVETLLCLAASLVVDHSRFGSSSNHRAPQPVPALAALFRRPNSSILAKMANLDGSRSNGAKYEIEVAAQLLSTTGQLGHVYLLLLSAARSAGIGPDLLPDFLPLDADHAELTLLGQDELTVADVEGATQDDVARWAARRHDLDDSVTERLLVAAVRVGQHRFAGDVLRNCGHHCVFCGMTVTRAGRRAPRMLVASHIKPWRTSKPQERRDVANGLAACPTHDVAFDTGLLTVDSALGIEVAADVKRALILNHAGIHAAFGRPPLSDVLLLPRQAVRPSANYLDWHRENIFADVVDRGGSPRGAGHGHPR